MKILYYIPSIGNPNIDSKLEILNHNLKYLFDNHENLEIDLCINCYNCYEEIDNFKFDKVGNIYIYKKPGVITQLWMTNPNNDKIVNYDYVLFIFDDIKILNLDLYKMAKIKMTYNIQVLSPKVLNATHEFMKDETNKLILHNHLEIYCLLLTSNDFEAYKSMNTVENKWGWGVDFLFGYYKISAAICSYFEVNHELPSNSNHHEANILMNYYFRKLGLNYPGNILDYMKKIYPTKIKELECNF
jgi:hypothetical protein